MQAPGRALAAVAALFLAALAWVAAWVPFHHTDALIYGRWSRLIELQGEVAPGELGAGYLHRPLVYVVQGELWGLVGFHEWIGRLWSWLFVVLLVVAVWRLAASERGGAVAGGLAAVALVAMPDVVALGAAGMTDVPVAATVAATGLLVLATPDGRRRWAVPALIVLAAAAAGLSKPSAFAALAAIGLALLVGPRTTLGERVRWRGVPLAAGTLLALAWNVVQARRVGAGIVEFLQGAGGDVVISDAVVSYYEQLNAQSRASFIAGMEWLGPYLTLPLLFALVYAVVRAAGRPHRAAATVAAPAGVALAVALPLLADAAGGTLGPFDPDRPVALLATLVLIVPLWLSRDCPEDEAPSRTNVVRMLVWAAPPTLAWIASAPFQTRYLSPAWAPLVALIAWSLWTAVRGCAERRRGLGWVVVATVCAIGVVDLRNLDALGTRTDGSIDAGRAIRELGVTGWFDRDEALRAADPALAALLADTETAMAGGGRLITVDGRLGFHWPLRTVRSEPQRCTDVRGFETLVVTEAATGLDADREAALGDAADEATGGRSSDVAFWPGCDDPRVEPLAVRPGEYGVFRVAP